VDGKEVRADGNQEEGGQEEEEVGLSYGGEGVQPLPATRLLWKEVMKIVAKKKAAKKKGK